MTDRLDESLFGTASQPVTEPDSQSTSSNRRDRRQGSGPSGGPPPKRRKTAVWLVLALFVGGLVLALTLLLPWIRDLRAPSDFDGEGNGQVTVVIKPGDTGHQIATSLEQAGVVKTVKAFETALEENKGAALQPGTYQLRQQMSAASALALLRDPASKAVLKVTVREGLWNSEVFPILAKATGKPLSAYQAAAKNPSLLGLPKQAKGNLEGYLFPATYSFEPGDSAQKQLHTMVAETIKQMDALSIPAAKRQRTLIIASIVEGEARHGADRSKVARVIENRLAIKQKLQMDSTVNYAVQRRSVTTSDKERAADRGYGTYARTGLPVGPIGNPGAASMRAALSPEPGNWLFFVTVNPETGETRFAHTAAEHAVNVKAFQAWCTGHPGRC